MDEAKELVLFVEELKRQWVATIDALIDPLMIVNSDYSIAKANRAMAEFTTIGNVKNLIGKTCYKVFAGRNKPCEGCKMQEAAAKKEPINFHLSNIKERYFEVTSQPIFDQNGDTLGMVQNYRDRTEAKALQEQLFQQEKLASIGLLAGGFAHEINNPLGGALIFSQMLLREMPKDSPHYADVVEIEAATQRCKSIVERLLDFARTKPTDTKEETSLAPVLVSEAAKNALRFGKVAKQAKKVVIKEDWGKVKFPVIADRNKIVSLFLNLIQNAFHAMPDGGQLRLSENQFHDDRQRLWGSWTVEDTGVGIAQKNLSRIFDPFFTSKQPGEGTGLGLSISYGICKELGGSLTVKSAINMGTVFTIKLPLHEEGEVPKKKKKKSKK